jgi:RNA polymerase sigma factor (sigma-70 family)
MQKDVTGQTPIGVSARITHRCTSVFPAPMPMADCAVMRAPAQSAIDRPGAGLPAPSALAGAPEPAIDGSESDAAAIDHALMSAYAGGQAQAFDRLYQRHHRGLYRFIARLLGRDGARQVDEVFQDTWLRVIQSRAGWSAQGASFRTWLFTIAHHRVIDQWRKSGRELAWPDDERGETSSAFVPAGTAWADWPAADPSPPADERLFWRRAGERLLACLEELPLPQRTAFLMHHEHGLSVADIATAVGLNAETAKSRLRYAMNKLRLCMGAHLPPAFGAGGEGPR